MQSSGWMALALLSILAVSARADDSYGIGPIPAGFAGSTSGMHSRTPQITFHTTRSAIFPTMGGGYLSGYPFHPAYPGVMPWGAYSPLLNYPLTGGYNPFGLYGISPFSLPPIMIPTLPNDIGLPNPPPQPPPAPINPAPRGGGAIRGEPAGQFRPVDRRDRERAREPIRAEPAPLPVPQANPRTESDAWVESGQQAFAAGDYGRATEQFRRATSAAPEIGSSYFLLAQAQFALGKYPEAVATIHQGLMKLPDWPTTGPPLRDLYAGDIEAFADHQRRLDAAAAAHPDYPTLDFLRAYIRWFDGRRDEATSLFRQMRDRIARPEVIDRFLQVPPA